MRQVLYIFGDLAQSDITWLADNGRQQSPDPGTVLITAGQTVKSLLIVLEGALEVVTPVGAVLAELGAGDIVGEMSLIEQRLPEVSVRARSATRVLDVPLDLLRAKLESDSGFAARFYRALAVLLSDRLRRANVAAQGGMNEKPGHSELDDGLLDNLHVAGDRMRRLLALLEGRTV
ncbi:MAG: cyclic nucleotide-binding domain-containing protein [Pseudomonadota bacterium]